MTLNLIILTKIDTRAYREDEGDAPKLVKVAVNPARIRCFNPRREGDGTRITFADGGGFAVQETGSEILTMLGFLSTAEYEAAPVRREAPAAPVLTVVDGGTIN
jgi:hypothetical protein